MVVGLSGSRGKREKESKGGSLNDPLFKCYSARDSLSHARRLIPIPVEIGKLVRVIVDPAPCDP